MSHPRFLADHDLNEHLITGLLRREPSIEFVRVRDVGLETRDDDVLLAYAANEGLLVVSHDVNTMTATAHQRTMAGRPMGGLLMVHQMDPI